MGQRVSAKREKPVPAPIKVAMRGRHGGIPDNKLPAVLPKRPCYLRLAKQTRIKDWLTLEIEFITRQNSKKVEECKRREKAQVDNLRGSPTTLAKVVEIFAGEQHAIVVVEGYKREWFIPVLSIVDKNLLHVNSLVLVKCAGTYKTTPLAVVGVLSDEVDSSAAGYKIEKAPKESFDDIGGLESAIQELTEAVELPLTHPEYYEEMGISPPKGVILYGPPGTGKTLLAKAVANKTSATFLRASGSYLIQKHGGEGPRRVRELFKLAREYSPCIVFLDEIDAVGTKRFDTSSKGEQELLNQLDGFDKHGEVKVIMATNRIDSLDPALIRPGRIDRKIELPHPDEKTKRKIFLIQSGGMTLGKDVDFDKLLAKERGMSGADIKAICMEAGMLALRGQRKLVTMDDMEKAVENVLMKAKDTRQEAFYV